MTHNPIISSYSSYKASLKCIEDKAAEEEDVIEQRELANLRRTGGKAPPLWSRMAEFAGMSRAIQRAVPASVSSPPPPPAPAAPAPDSSILVEDTPPSSPSHSLPPAPTAPPVLGRGKRQRQTERFEEALGALGARRGGITEPGGGGGGPRCAAISACGRGCEAAASCGSEGGLKSYRIRRTGPVDISIPQYG